ncbi:MAG: Hsp20/alpha crystallin family protein [Armatimonadetes bacterium]|nr:Hsp20/alpha crystallin family protein [Armatimonadota bacterium]MDW8028717.1 Hsp20/alpha crystallin family protein [Armatimonadota bacterium]
MAKLAQWKPTIELERWFDRFDRSLEKLLSDFLGDLDRNFWSWSRKLERLTPAIEITETSDSYIVQVEVPGVKVEDIEVTLQDDILTIKGKRERSEERKDEIVHWVERAYGEFSRSIRIPSDVKIDEVEATYKDGILKVRLPRTEESKPRRIEVKVA